MHDMNTELSYDVWNSPGAFPFCECIKVGLPGG